ncbi:MAG: hypothetical protein C5B52_14730 [Bacteroidetes bacterium]|nr:MAG: hypothetical protein C5B52_14730 [Bacteroidota bacterium]
MIYMFYAVLRWKKTTAKKIGDEKLVTQLIRNYSSQKFAIKFGLLGLAFLGVVLAAANIQSATQVEKVNRQGIDVMIALDVSKSMMAEDMKPNRLERAKVLVNRLMDKMENDRIGFVIFAGRAYLQMPLTTDHGAARMYVGNASPDAVPTQGTVISEALRICDMAFNNKDKKYKAVVLISDGEDHDENAIKTSSMLAGNGVMINTVGVGTTTGAPIIDPVTGDSKRDDQGNIVISKLNEAELIQISQKGNGIYQQLNDAESVADKLAQQMGGMEQRAISDNSLANYRSFFQWFLAFALALLIGELFVAEKKMKLKT